MTPDPAAQLAGAILAVFIMAGLCFAVAVASAYTYVVVRKIVARANHLVNLASVHVLVLETALRQWKCPACGGRGTYLQRRRETPRELPKPSTIKCSVCDGTGLHPTAVAALTATPLPERSTKHGEPNHEAKSP